MAGSGTAHLRPDDEVLLRVEDLVVEFPAGRGRTVRAVSGVSFDLARGETLGIVGESGCGKSSAARALVQLPPPRSGSVRLDGLELTALRGEALRRTRRRLQMIFQDPISSLNPRRRVRDIVGEGPRVWQLPGDRVDEVLEAVGLDPATAAERRPHEFSGGQCQRISIARALILDPEVVICDEPVSALDVSVQAQILGLLEDLKDRYRLTLVFIAHDLAVVKNVSDRILVMYLGKVCELAPSADLISRPAHPYTRALIASIPGGGGLDLPPADTLISGEPPSPVDPPSGCRFRTRCPRAAPRCATEEPHIRQVGDDHWLACHFPVKE
ncbi:Oligopeptide transport ATP-binding protein OppF (TC 3.A.1.5.1) [[Actinomadura] parvosata subsp. kistnae]|uniref:Peptide ABC transporter ATP-binding protein n=1 Tax=[Actinomadura] parvosata subsp. kistnae TaxID=1909395 RepID=A0A1V0A856_9ACTN|nr:oligopeptide/dipeptide ABC transporter ATP-binding protein [Nonomuraea sp. ATCC 55076]AQZ66370.1 peptide ABC transporter ATP-binding protein [Nonomuraea sp. ATCC 55076]SPL95599.1 Oligopeptide transport ATP-binding protein OppF (TC 3.A.1.5.1) [Actinomadura parvosata subsp. kistnae]